MSSDDTILYYILTYFLIFVFIHLGKTKIFVGLHEAESLDLVIIYICFQIFVYFFNKKIFDLMFDLTKMVNDKS